MSQFAIVALLAWPVVALILFAALGPWRGVIATVLGGYLLLSGRVVIPMSGLPDYTKFTAVSLGALVGIVIFDASRLAAFRFRWYDMAAVVMCVIPAASIVSNSLPIWDAVSAVSDAVLAWGLPYFIGRLYADRLGADRDLALGLAIAGGLLAPMIVFEVVTHQSISGLIYGLRISNGFKHGYYSPILMLTNQLELGLWATLMALVSFTLWCARSVRSLAGVPFGFWTIAAFVGAVFCHQTAALGFLGLGCFLIALTVGRTRFGMSPVWAAAAAVVVVAPKLGGTISLLSLITISLIVYLRNHKPRLLIHGASLIAPIYLFIRVTGAMSRRALRMTAYALLGAERGQSLDFRFANEDRMITHTMHQPILGWGTFAGGRGWADQHIIVDSLWITYLPRYGLIGLAALYALFCLPVVLCVRRRPVDSWDQPRNAATAALTVCLVIYTLDSLLNAYTMLPIPLIVGLVIALPSVVGGSRSWGRVESKVDRELEVLGRMATSGRAAEAEAACRRLIAARADDPTAKAGLADACDFLADLRETLGQFAEAESPRRHALNVRHALAAATPGESSFRDALAGTGERLARNLVGRGQFAEAAEIRGLVLEQRAALAAVSPDDPDVILAYTDVLNDLAWLLAITAEPSPRSLQRAVSLAEQAVRLRPDRKIYWNTLGAAYRQSGQPGPAVAAIERSLRLGPDEGGFDDALLASALADLGEMEGAQKALARLDDRLSTLGPTAPASLRRLRAEAVNALPAPSPVVIP